MAEAEGGRASWWPGPALDWCSPCCCPQPPRRPQPPRPAAAPPRCVQAPRNRAPTTGSVTGARQRATVTAVPSLRQVVAALDARYQPGWAEPWDAVGLVCGDPDAPVGRVLFAVDPVAAVAADGAVAAGNNRANTSPGPARATTKRDLPRPTPSTEPAPARRRASARSVTGGDRLRLGGA